MFIQKIGKVVNRLATNGDMNELPWPPLAPTTPLAVLVSGGLDSAVLLAEATRHYPAVYPLYVRTGSRWEEIELCYLKRFLTAINGPTLKPLHQIHFPVDDLYGQHWSLSGENVPDANSPDEAVFLPGRNVILLSKALIWCHLNQIPTIAMAPLDANPFPDATSEFFTEMANVVSRAVNGALTVITPYRHLHKAAVIPKAGTVPLQHTFSCINPIDRQHCGQCNKCAERQHAFREANIPDPTTYASHTISEFTRLTEKH